MEYVHMKSGRIYKVLSTNIINATNKDDGKIMVLYEGMKRDGSGISKFVRQYDEFMEKFKPHNTTQRLGV